MSARAAGTDTPAVRRYISAQSARRREAGGGRTPCERRGQGPRPGRPRAGTRAPSPPPTRPSRCRRRARRRGDRGAARARRARRRARWAGSCPRARGTARSSAARGGRAPSHPAHVSGDAGAGAGAGRTAGSMYSCRRVRSREREREREGAHLVHVLHETSLNLSHAALRPAQRAYTRLGAAHARRRCCGPSRGGSGGRESRHQGRGAGGRVYERARTSARRKARPDSAD